MMHYVDDLSTKSIKRNGVDSATFTEEQTAFCGLKLQVKSRKEFATRVQGIGVVDCPDCLSKYRARLNKPFDCVRCEKILEHNDIMALSPADFERLCLECRKKTK